MTTFKVNVSGREATVEVARQGNDLRVVYNGKTAYLRLIYTDGSSFVLEQEEPDGRRRLIRAAGDGDGDRRQLWVNGHTFTYRRVRRQAHAASGHDTGSLSATIPAVVSEVLVNVGDTVIAGDKLILLESMKMVIPIQAPYDGTVTSINCAAGDAVQPNVPLVALEPLETE